MVVLYIGSNDLLDFGGNRPKSANEMQALYETLFKRLHERLPNATIVVLATFPSPLNAKRADLIQAVNDRVRRLAAGREEEPPKP